MPEKATLTVAETLPKSFLLSCRTRGDKPAMREKRYGIWNAISWNQWLERSKAVSFALYESGFRPGDVASVLANTVPEWNYADFGILCAGGVSSGIYPTDSAKQLEYLINDSKTSVLFVEDDEQLDKALDVRERCPTLRKIVVFDMEGLRTFSDPMVVSLDEFMAAGRNYAQGKDALFEAALKARLAPFIDEVEQLVATFPGPSRELLRLMMRLAYSRMFQPDAQALMRIIISEGRRFPAITELYHRETVAKGRRMISAIVARGVDRGEFRAGDAADLPIVVMAPTIMAAVWKMTFEPFDPLDLEKFAEAHADLAFNGLLVRAATSP